MDSFTKASYVFRENQMVIKDSIFGLGSKTPKFYDFQEQKQDTYEKARFNFIDERYAEYAQAIVELEFTNSDTVVYTTHKVETLLTLLSSIAGYPNLFLIICGFLLGRFQRFYSNFEMYKFFNTEYHSEKPNSNPDNPSKDT